MLSVRVPLATIVDPQQQQLSPLKGLSLADKENTVSAPGGGGRGQGGGVLWVGGGAGRPLTTHLPAAPFPQRDPRAGQQDREEDLPGALRAGE